MYSSNLMMNSTTPCCEFAVYPSSPAVSMAVSQLQHMQLRGCSHTLTMPTSAQGESVGASASRKLNLTSFVWKLLQIIILSTLYNQGYSLNQWQGFSCIENYEAAASAKFCAASSCEKTQAGSQCKRHWTASIKAFSSYFQNPDHFLYTFTWYFFTQNHHFYSISTYLRDLMSINSNYVITSVWVNERDARIHLTLPHTHSEARVTLELTSASAVSLNEDIHEQHLQNCSERHFRSILPLDLSSVISHTHRTIHGNPSN